jgi:glycosyltransferase involved in cell wall biosynthesis
VQSFTIAIPTHDRRETVVLAARSALAQEHAPEQVIVLCDGCTDGTSAALAEIGDPRLQVLDLPKGPGYGYEHRDRALELARGEAIVYLGDDDLLAPDHLARIAAATSTEIDLVGTPAAVIEPDDAMAWIGADWSVPSARARMQRENSNVMAGVAIRVQLARAIGGWDSALARAADWDLWRRALDAGARPAATTEPTVLHFRATGRTQPWPERVAQNERWWAALQDPAALAELRRRLARLRAERDSQQLDDLLEMHVHAAALAAACTEKDAYIADLIAHLEAERAHRTREVSELTARLRAALPDEA